MKNNIYLFIFSYLLLLTACSSPIKSLDTSGISLKFNQFSQLDSLMSKEQRPVAVFLHAKWCKFCKNMEQTTFQDEEVIRLLNKKYYFISFDGEQKEEVAFRNHQFKYQATGKDLGTHELATALGSIDGQLIYPTFVLLNPKYEIIFQYQAFLNSQDLKKILEEGVK